MQQNLNVPKELVRRYAATKRRKELLSFAIWLKMQRENSVVYNMNDKQVRYQCHVGKAKAQRLLVDAREENTLFSFNGDTITVKSFRDKTIKYGKHRVKYQSDFCFKFPYKKDYALRDIYNLINEFLATDIINTHERKTACYADDSKDGRGASCSMSLKKLSQQTRMSWSSTRRIMERMKDKGVIAIEHAERHCFLMAEELEQEAKDFLRRHGLTHFTFVKGMNAYVVFPRSYSIVSRDWSERFQHVLYNFRSRTSDNFGSTIPQLCGF